LKVADREEAGIDILGFFSRRKWLIVFGLLVGLGLGYLKYLRDPAAYRSTGRVNVIKEHARLPILGNGSAVEPMGMRVDLRSDIELIMSETIVKPAIEGGVAFPTPAGADGENDLPPVEIQPIRELGIFAGSSNPVQTVISGLKVSQLDVGSSVLVISFEGSDPEDCSAIINNVIRSYQAYLGAAYKSVANDAYELLRKAGDDLNADLREKEGLILAMHQNAPPGVSGGTNIHQTRMDAIEAERAGMQIRKGRLSTQLERIQSAMASGQYSREAILLMVQQLQQEEEPTVAGDNRPFNIAQEIFPLILEEASLLTRYGEDHPDVIEIRRQIEMTRNFLEENLPEDATRERVDFLTLFIQSMELELSHLTDQLAELDKQYEQEETAARELIAHTLELQNLESDKERLQTMWQSVVTLLQNLEITKDHGDYRAEVIALAGSGRKVAPNLYSSLPIGGILGMLGGILLAAVAEMADKSFKTPAEIASLLGVRVIGHTPVFPRSVASRGDKKSKLDPSLIAHHNPKSRSAEAFRAIRTALYFSSRGNQNRVIQMTSPEPRDGKSTMTANLAISIAQSGKKVILIDADFRRPRVHLLFGLNDKVGMSSAITGETELPEAIQASEVENLDCLPCGPRPDNPAELLTSAKFDELLAVLRDKYDYVLVDSPPILAVTDPGAIASRVDGVLMTLRINAQARHAATQSVDILRDLGANLLGVIVNGVDAGSSYGYRGYHYSYSYSQHKSKTSSYYAETESRR
jgi:capsular exopolysaccharide synthesis family protein